MVVVRKAVLLAKPLARFTPFREYTRGQGLPSTQIRSVGTRKRCIKFLRVNALADGIQLPFDVGG